MPAARGRGGHFATAGCAQLLRNGFHHVADFEVSAGYRSANGGRIVDICGAHRADGRGETALVVRGHAGVFARQNAALVGHILLE